MFSAVRAFDRFFFKSFSYSPPFSGLFSTIKFFLAFDSFINLCQSFELDVFTTKDVIINFVEITVSFYFSFLFQLIEYFSLL